MASGAPRSRLQPGVKALQKASSACGSTAAAPRDSTWPIWMSSKLAGTGTLPGDSAGIMAVALAKSTPRFAPATSARHIAALVGGRLRGDDAVPGGRFHRPDDDGGNSPGGAGEHRPPDGRARACG